MSASPTANPLGVSGFMTTGSLCFDFLLPSLHYENRCCLILLEDSDASSHGWKMGSRPEVMACSSLPNCGSSLAPALPRLILGQWFASSIPSGKLLREWTGLKATHDQSGLWTSGFLAHVCRHGDTSSRRSGGHGFL